MASSAVPPPIRPPRRRAGRLPVALVAAVSGLAVLGVGLARTAGELDNPRPLTTQTDLPGGSATATGPDDGPGPSGSENEPGASAGSDSSGGGPVPPPGTSVAPSPGLSPGSSPADGRLAILGVRLQAELDRVRAKLAIPGVSATILLPDGASWSGASGLADVSARVAASPDTGFAFASISKTFTSALILELAGEGRLRLSDPAISLLPPIGLAIDKRITVAMLLDHTSGLADYFLNPGIDQPLQAVPGAAWSAGRALGFVGRRLGPPGGSFHYSNTNYLLLGLIAERATGQSLGVAIRQWLLDPAGLDSIWMQVDEAAPTDLAHGYRFVGTKRTARPIDLADGSGMAPFRSVVTAAGGAGAMAGTSGDLARWARALYSGGVLGPGGTALLFSGFGPAPGYATSGAYGFGIQAVSIDGHPSLGHSGRLLGFRGAVRHFPLDGITIAVLTNQSRADPGTILRALLAISLIPSPPCGLCPVAS